MKILKVEWTSQLTAFLDEKGIDWNWQEIGTDKTILIPITNINQSWELAMEFRDWKDKNN